MHNGAPFTKRTLNFNVAITPWWEPGVSYPPFLTPDVTCLFPRRFSVPYLLNPASVTALNAKALPRQMIKVRSQFTLQCNDLMFPNLPGLFLKLPRTFRIFYSIPLFPLPLSLSLSHVSAASATKNRDDRDISLVMFAYESRLHSTDYKNGLLKITHLKSHRRHLKGRPLQNIPPFTTQLLLLIHLLFQILF